MAATQPLILYSHNTGPNPWKVAIILEELKVPYETKFLDFPAMKQEPFESLNPNGRVPALEDPNTGVKMFESGAIIEYLIETYDASSALSYAGAPEKWLLKSWLHFQVSGQGPYYGQKAWFAHFHPEKNIASAIERYSNEIRRVVGVIDRHLKKQGTQYLVGGKCTYADLAFVPWHLMLGTFLMPGWDFAEEFPAFAEWNERLMARESVKKILEDKKKASEGVKH